MPNEAHRAEMERVVAQITNAIVGEKHALALDCLMFVYRELAADHSCCTAACASQAWAVSTHLQCVALSNSSAQSPAPDSATAIDRKLH